jgi:hypothetical protein
VIDAYFASLAGLKLRPETVLYLGLVHRDNMAGNAGGSAVYAAVARPQYRQIDESLLQRAAAPYIGSKRAGRFDRAY